MRLHLKDEIWKNSLTVIDKLHEYVWAQQNKAVSLVKKTHKMPLYRECIKKCVKFTLIEAEVRCGQYYLRIWVD